MVERKDPPRVRIARRNLKAAIACLDALGLHQAAAHADLARVALETAWPEHPGVHVAGPDAVQ